MNTERRVMLSGVLAILVVAWQDAGQAAIIINDNFDSYANQAAFEAAWIPSGTSGSLTSDIAYSAPNSIRNPAAGTRRNDQTFSASTATDIVATNANSLVWSYRFYDDPANIVPSGNSLGRTFGQLLGRNSAGSLNQILSMGLWNSNAPKASNGVTSTLTELRQYYAIRVGFTPGPNWIVLDTVAPRSAGWQEMKAVIASTQVQFYINGVLGGTWNYASSEGAVGWYQARIGSGVSSGAASNFDDYRLQVVPEPSAMLLSAIGLMGLVGYRRRQS